MLATLWMDIGAREPTEAEKALSMTTAEVFVTYYFARELQAVVLSLINCA